MSVHEIDRGNGVAEIVLRDDGDGIKLTTAQIRELNGFVGNAHDPSRLITIIRQEGDDFCLGRIADADEHGEPVIYELLAGTTDLWAKVPGVTIAAASGRIQGFGVGFVMQADISIVADDAVFRFPEIEAGFAPAIVAAWLVKRLSWQTIAPWLLTAAPIQASVARGLGLVGELAATAELSARADAYREALLGFNADAVREIKRFSTAALENPSSTWVQSAVDSLVRQHVEAVEKSAAH
ncbi:MAG TPA: enoyl-CoA hydratase/isomerase family protein [Gryllotalpicola sp.]